MVDKKQDLQEKDYVDGGVKRRRRSRKTIGEEGSRKQTAVGLIATIALGLMFYLPTEFRSWWKKFNTSETITIEKPVGDSKNVSEILGFKVTIKEKQDAEEVIEKLIEELTGDYGVYVKQLVGDGEIGIGENRVLGAASVIKLPILVAYYQAVDKGTIDANEVYVLKEIDRFEYGTGSMQGQPVGTKYSKKQVAYLMANQSDNMAAQVMLKFLGGESRVDKIITGWGLEQTNIKENEATAYEMGELLARVYDGELISEDSREELFDNLTNTVNEDRITAGVPTGVKVVHKFGSEIGIVNDCGIVYGEDAYVICVLSHEVNDGEAQEVLPKISRVVWEWMGNE